MRVEMLLGLKDVPGMLVRSLEPISGNGGNIISVLHARGKADVVRVNVVFSVRDEATLNNVLDALKSKNIGFRQVKVEGHRYYSKKSIVFILVGHVIDQDIQDTIDEINRFGLVKDVDVRMSDPHEKSAVLMRVNVDESKVRKLMECIHGICTRKKFLFIREVSV